MNTQGYKVTQRFISGFIIIGIALSTGCGQQPPAWSSAPGVIIQQSPDAGVSEKIHATSTATPSKVMKGSGLAGATGGTHVKLFRGGSFDIRLPVPQLADGQAPVWYDISTTPREALEQYRIIDCGDGNIFICVKLKGAQNLEITINWSAVVLLAGNNAVPDMTLPEPYTHASPCAQSADKLIEALSSQLWPASGSKVEYAKNIQEHIRKTKPLKQPRSLDAIGILKSGWNGICTANANLASALFRARQIPCRSTAVIPSISHRLEMHRIVEYFENGKWVSFDPSLVQADIPMKPWQNIIMAKTTMQDEAASMKPRPGAMPGCPLGQELEIAGMGLGFFGNDFFWTISTPLAEFEVTAEAFNETRTAWKDYLKTGKVSAGQAAAASASNLNGYIEAIKGKR